jgi:hypothetical protein
MKLATIALNMTQPSGFGFFMVFHLPGMDFFFQTPKSPSPIPKVPPNIRVTNHGKCLGSAER